MARELSDTLKEQQKWGLISRPVIQARIVKKWGNVIRYDFESVYSGAEEDYLHTATMPSDGSLIRLRVANPGSTKDLYYQRVTSPDDESDFTAWTDLSIANVIAVASCSNGADVSQFYIDDDGDVYQRTSADSGANWGAWAEIISYWGYGCKGVSAVYKPNGDIALTFLGASAPRVKVDTGENTGAWVSGTNWWVQSFEPPENHTLDYIELKLWRLGNPGTITVSIYEADVDGYPTGSILTSKSFDGLTISEGAPGTWLKIDLTNISLDSTKSYCILLKAPDGDVDNYIYWRVNNTNPYADGHMSLTENSGDTWTTYADWDAMFRVYAYLVPPGRPSLYCYFDENGATWTLSANTAPAISNTTGISIYYYEDWNLVVTYGATDAVKGVKTIIYGDGDRQASGTWSSWETIIERTATEPFTYSAPFIAHPDTTRLYFVERHTQAEITNHIFYSHMPPAAHFDAVAWLEPVPTEPQSEYGLAFTLAGSYAWLTNAKRVFRALATEDALVLTARLLEIDSRDYPDIFKGSLKVVLDNTGGWYDDFNRLGQQLEVRIGYVTSEGNEYSLVPFRWITKFKLIAPPWYPLRMIYPIGVIGTLQIETEDAWTFLYRYRTRRHLEWAADTKSVKELLQFFIARCGLDFDVISQSDTIQNFKPAFEVRTGTSYRTAIKNLLKMVPDQLVFREAKVLLRNPTTEEAVDWTYHTTFGTALLVFRGSYGETAWDPNRAEVWGDTFMKMAANWPQVAMVRDRLSRVTSPTYPDTTRAGERAAAELRRAEILTGGESSMHAPMNCGLEAWDVLQITDTNAGVSTIRRRVLRVKAYWNARHWAYHQIIKLGAD